MSRDVWGCQLWALALALVVAAGCGGGGETSCSEQCGGKCGQIGECQCGACDVCQGDQCEGDGRCVPQCDGKACGDDGCGGECGVCEGSLECNEAGLCVEPCVPVCDGKECGDDQCGGECGECTGTKECNSEGACVEPCVPQCNGAECGDDQCGGTCGECSEELPYCQHGVCKVACEPLCEGKECGDDDCGGWCGTCDSGYGCTEQGACVCEAGGCDGKVCGDDGCGGTCGTCSANNELCVDGQCVCQPDCVEKECGGDGCGGECGTCKLNHVCTGDGTCVCMPDCSGKMCGPDGCGSLCGQCACGEDCLMYQCEFTACEGKECGLDGCGGECGSCGAGKACILGACPPEGLNCDDQNAVQWDGCHEGKMSEFRVNDSESGDQEAPDVAALADGSYVVVWQDSMGDAASWAIKGKLLPPDGSLPEDEFLVNTYQYSAQSAPSITTLTGGGFVVVWQSDGEDGALNGVFGQRFKANGSKQGSEFQANTFTEFNQKAPNVGSLKDGGFVVVWEGEGQDGMGFGVFGQRYDEAGLKVGEEFRLNTETISNQQMAVVTGLTGGGFFTIWGSYSSGAIAWDLFGQKWGTDGEALGGEIAINAPWSQDGTTLNYQVYARMAPLANDGLVAVWQSTLQDGSEDGVYAQRFSNSGKVGTEQMVHEAAEGNQQYPDVASLPDGGYVVAWQATGKDGSGFGVMARRFSGQGVAAGGDVLLNGYSAGDQARPRVDAFADGSIVVVWQSKPQDASGTGVYARRMDSNGAWIYR